MKKCLTCENEVSDHFNKKYCKSCKLNKKHLQQKQWRINNREKDNERIYRYRIKNPEKMKLSYKKYHENNKEKGVIYRREYHKRRYNITLADFNNMLKLQDNKCSICNNTFKNSKDTNIDHCHSSNKVRSLLCYNCNVGLGHFRDNITYLNTAIDYLNKHKGD